ncbi:PDZ and LIM domain protein 4, partial [Ophiophagus hannah]
MFGDIGAISKAGVSNPWAMDPGTSLKAPGFFSLTEMQDNHTSEECLAISQRPVTRENHARNTKDTIPLHCAARTRIKQNLFKTKTNRPEKCKSWKGKPDQQLKMKCYFSTNMAQWNIEKDVKMPKLIHETVLKLFKINPGSKAALANLCPGDVILSINGDSTENMTHLEAQNKIKACLDQLILSVK